MLLNARRAGFLSLLLTSAPAVACPDCPTSRLVRAAVCGPGFGAHLAATLAPLALLAALAGALRALGRPRSGDR